MSYTDYGIKTELELCHEKNLGQTLFAENCEAQYGNINSNSSDSSFMIIIAGLLLLILIGLSAGVLLDFTYKIMYEFLLKPYIYMVKFITCILISVVISSFISTGLIIDLIANVMNYITFIPIFIAYNYVNDSSI